jgi:hypothetical protein
MKKMLTILSFALLTSTTYVMAQEAGSVNGIKITVKEADKALEVLTKGQKTWKTLPPKDKKQLIQLMAPSKLVAAKAKKSLTKEEKEAAYTGFWMQKKMASVKISDNDAKLIYKKMVKASSNSKNKQKIPPFESVKNNIKMQLAQEKVVANLMKNAKIKIK